MRKILTKKQFYSLWRKNVLGNHPRIFKTITEAIESGCPRIGFREAGVPGGRFDLVLRSDALRVAKDWEAEGRIYSLDGSVDPAHAIFQGELMRSYKGLEGHIAINPRMNMRESLKRGMHSHIGGARLAFLLRHYMDGSSYEDVMELMDQYPESVIEFSVFDRMVGEFPGRNTIVWEIRNY